MHKPELEPDKECYLTNKEDNKFYNRRNKCLVTPTILANEEAQVVVGQEVVEEEALVVGAAAAPQAEQQQHCQQTLHSHQH